MKFVNNKGQLLVKIIILLVIASRLDIFYYGIRESLSGERLRVKCVALSTLHLRFGGGGQLRVAIT